MLRPKYIMIAVIAWLACLSATAFGDSAAVIAGGNAAANELAMVARAVELEAQRAGWSLPQTPLTKAETEPVLTCKDVTKPWVCVASSLGRKGIDRAFVVFVDASKGPSGTPQLVVTIKLIATEPEALILRQKYCDSCAADRLSKLSSELTQELISEHASRGGRTVLDIKSVPPGAELLLDGKPVGVTDTVLRTAPGKHVITIKKDGYRVETREVETAVGETAEVSIELHATTVTDKPTTRRGSKLPAGLLFGTGIATLGAGIAIIAVGQQEGPENKFRYTFPRAYLGAGISVVASVMIGLGAGLLWGDSEPTSAPTVSVTAGGGVVGWTRTF